jgi:hypothetical protein
VQKHALKSLAALGVDVRLNKTVVKTSALPTGQTEVTFSDGSRLITDLYVPTYGLVPNSSYIPPEFLSSEGFVIVDDYFKVKGAGDVWAIGDVVDVEWKQWVFMDKQSSHVAKNIVLILGNKAPIPYKVTPASSRMSSLLFTSSSLFADMYFDHRSIRIFTWPEDRDWGVWKLQDSESRHFVGSEGAFHSEYGSYGLWNFILINSKADLFRVRHGVTLIPYPVLKCRPCFVCISSCYVNLL